MANVKIKYYEPIINKPDYQGRIYKKGMEWMGRVHERIVGVKYYSLLPSDEESYCIKHYKNITKQEQQNNLYGKIENYMSTTKKKCAVFTIVKNENYFLPIWLKHYKRYFDNSDIYVLNHQSTDGSTEGLDVNVELIVNELAFDHQWLVDTVQNFQVKLLEQYESVLFAESDELVYTLGKPLNEVIDDFLLDTTSIVQTCTAKEVMENIGVEKELEPGDKIFEHRNQWYDNPIYHKTLLSKVPIKWVWGFHFSQNTSVDKRHNLQLVHLHRCDFNFMLKRHEERATKWNLKNDGGAGFQHKIGDREGVLKYFNDIESKLEIIPQEHKDALNGI